ncbi:MAG: PLP-dependent aminotransferase family protein [Candidatus Aenigmarchaeota archaeon]|nr:PLP-dependent aminotransferase family protein [Candidatus Aenigmarchaeota archaeon]
MKWKFSEKAENLTGSRIRELLKLVEKPDMISFGGGMPSPETFPIDYITERLPEIMKKYGTKMLQYGKTSGEDVFKEAIIKRMKKRNIICEKENIIVSSGSQQLLNISGIALLNEGDKIITETPTYLGELQALKLIGPRYETVQIDNDGMIVEQLEEKMKKYNKKKMPKSIYVIPTFQNPSGVTMSKDRRKHLLEISENYQIPIIEDDPYSELRFEGDEIPPIKSMDKNGNVLYLSTVSKILAPGFRLGWAIGDKELIEKLILIKQGTDLCTNVFAQYIAADYLISDEFEKNLNKTRKLYKKKRDAMIEALEKYMPEEVKYNHPTGGMFIWLKVPDYINTEKMLKKAINNNIAYVDSKGFDPLGKNTHGMRLNFSYPSLEDIETGVERLGTIIQEEIDEKRDKIIRSLRKFTNPLLKRTD